MGIIEFDDSDFGELKKDQLTWFLPTSILFGIGYLGLIFVYLLMIPISYEMAMSAPFIALTTAMHVLVLARFFGLLGLYGKYKNSLCLLASILIYLDILLLAPIQVGLATLANLIGDPSLFFSMNTIFNFAMSFVIFIVIAQSLIQLRPRLKSPQLVNLFIIVGLIFMAYTILDISAFTLNLFFEYRLLSSLIGVVLFGSFFLTLLGIFYTEYDESVVPLSEPLTSSIEILMGSILPVIGMSFIGYSPIVALVLIVVGIILLHLIYSERKHSLESFTSIED